MIFEVQKMGVERHEGYVSDPVNIGLFIDCLAACKGKVVLNFSVEDVSFKNLPHLLIVYLMVNHRFFPQRLYGDQWLLAT